MTVSPVDKMPGMTRILVTAVISAVCSAGIVAGILVLALTQGPEVSTDQGIVTSDPPHVADIVMQNTFIISSRTEN